MTDPVVQVAPASVHQTLIRSTAAPSAASAALAQQGPSVACSAAGASPLKGGEDRPLRRYPLTTVEFEGTEGESNPETEGGDKDRSVTTFAARTGFNTKTPRACPDLPDADGGDDAPWNVRASHLTCNLRRQRAAA